MMELELFQIYHLKEMSLSAELFLSCSILQFTFFAISTAYQRKAGFVILNKQVYYIATLLIILSSFLILNEDLLIMNSLSSNNFIINDYFSFASKLVICVTSFLFLIIINVSFRDEPFQNNFEYAVLITISILGLLLLCSSNDLITAYLAIELQSVAFYIMSAFKRNSSYSIESGLKYFIIGSLSSAFFLFGTAIIYGCMGSLSFDDLRIFFSLLFVTKSEVYSSIYSSFFDTFSKNEFLFSVFCLDSVVYFQGPLFSHLFERLDSSLPTLVIDSTTSDNLIDWCDKNNSASLAGIISLSLLNSGSVTTLGFSDSISQFLVIDLFSIYTQFFFYYYVSSMLFSCELIAPSCSDTWTYLLACDKVDFNTNLLLLKQIFVSYNDAILIGTLDTSSALNIDLVSIGFMLVCISLFIKLSIAPFHFWSLDVYEGSPNATTFFFAVVPKIGLFVLLMRICYVSFYQIFIDHYQLYFFVLAILSVFVGSFGGLEQRKLKTLLAYSSISHTGYLLLSFSTGNVEGMQMMFYYLVIYMVSGLCFWSVYMFLRQKRSFYFNKSNKELGDLVLLKESNPMLALILAITLFSIAGIPPMVGFLAKVGIFLVVVKSSAYLVSVFSILFSVISTFYYIRVIKILYFENTLVGKLYLPITTQKSLLISLLFLSLIILALDPMIIYLLFYKATLLVN
uniref:NADH dehydrogenase subunit 2 n=1 Tax=Tryblionella apiculata TaxID=1003145 RepID=A0A8F1B8D1_9STRA|nr:NADH dehydrogenase subunit 2 [Tryblionella apiculata]QWM93625.1 NADH dehydrogenase subunit 2 [Tryblionella apiculata]